MKLKALSLLVLLFSVFTVSAENDGKHEMSNYHAKIKANEFRNSRHIETTEISGKTYIKGKDNRYKEKETSRLTQPFADYIFSSKSMGGDYVITCFYRVDKDKANDECYISLGVDELEPQKLDIKESKGTHRISHTFDVKFLRGKSHTLKLWLPSKGVMVERFEIRRKLISTNNK